MTTLIVSDIHLGSRNSRADQLALLLRSQFDRLILNGDTVNNLNLKKFTASHWQLIEQLRSIARRRELVLIRGNHDVPHGVRDGFGAANVLATLLGVELREDYRLEAAGRSYLVLHGDQFDPTLNWPVITDVADWGYQAVQRLHSRGAKWLKHQAKKIGGVVEFVKRSAVGHARRHGCTGVVAGHTHFADDEWIDDVHYLNTGNWTEPTGTYVLADAAGIRLCYWEGIAAADDEKARVLRLA